MDNDVVCGFVMLLWIGAIGFLIAGSTGVAWAIVILTTIYLVNDYRQWSKIQKEGSDM